MSVVREWSNAITLTKVLDDLAQASESHEKHIEPSNKGSLFFRLVVRHYRSRLRVNGLVGRGAISRLLFALEGPHFGVA